MICVEQGRPPWDLKMFDTVQKKKKETILIRDN